MKKNILASLILVVGMTSLLAGCGGSKKDSEAENMGATVTNGKGAVTETKEGGTVFKDSVGEAQFNESPQEAQKAK
ncbi:MULTISPECIES: hypothetical protein [Carnobacterium]|uniref:hypothetical protein n=1 Tax=Carnobacterium TaxID=2747 RepID=UPI00191BBAAA|nr:hypothetical protein [Carnobacterium maltaromaticum]CAD5897476.1 putative lipoprotein [Carnobacterium maltaromaticum]